MWCGTDAGGNKASLVQFSEISYKHRHQLSPAAGGRRWGGGNLSHGPYTGGQWVAANTELGDTLQLLSMYGTGSDMDNEFVYNTQLGQYVIFSVVGAQMLKSWAPLGPQ